MTSTPAVSSFIPDIDGLGRFVRMRRCYLGLNEEDLAERLGMAPDRIRDVECGASGMPSLVELAGLASLLETSLADILQASGFELEDSPALALAREDANSGLALLHVVNHLLAIDSVSLKDALTQATTLLASVMSVDKIDAFVYEEDTNTLVAVGASETAMGRLQHRIGMDRMPVVNLGREVEVYTTGRPYVSGNAGADSRMLVGTTRGLGVQSMIAVPLVVNGVRRGVLVAEDARRDLFSAIDVPFFGVVAGWVGMIAQHAETAAELSATAATAATGVAEDLMTVLAHDLKNHLTPLAGHLNLARRRAELQGHSEDVRNLTASLRSALRAAHLADELLDAARLEQGFFALQYVSTDLVQLVRQTVRELGRDEETVRTTLPPTLVVDIDPARIRQALDNVLRNAIRHSPRGGTVYVELVADQNRSAAILTVRDSGAGISPDLLPGIFVRFARGPGSSGLGLGLYVARGVVDAHGGSLRVDSEEGRGSTFRFSLPMHAAP